jgi:acetyltransferase-like isoleucine patch superfamily enzyme
MFKALYWGCRTFGAIYRRLGMFLATKASRAVLARLDAGSVIQNGVRFDRPGSVSIGRDCLIWRGVGVAAEGPNATLWMGDRVEVNRDVLLDSTGGLRLADDVLISEAAVLYTHDHGLDAHAQPTLKPKQIDSCVWIGMRAVIMPNCRHIGAGAVVGAGAIVTRDVPAGAIVAGNPAVIVGQHTKVRVVA